MLSDWRLCRWRPRSSPARAVSGINSWTALQEAVNRAERGETIILTTDLTTSVSEDTAPTVPAGKRLTLDLNEHTLDRMKLETRKAECRDAPELKRMIDACREPGYSTRENP